MILGIDVSFWQGKIDWTKPHAAGAKFAFIRAGQGFDKDSRFTENWTGARGHQLRGAYHFYDYRPGKTAAAQASQMVQWMGADRGELPGLLDWEKNTYWTDPQPSGAAALSIIKEYVDTIRNLTGRTTIFYSNPATIAALGKIPDWLKALPLFIANYGVNRPTITGWDGWTFWQYALGKGRGPEFGVSSLDIDLDYFNGTLEELRAFSGVSIPPTPEPEKPPAEEKPTMGIYSNKARGLFLWEAHKDSDFTALAGKIDFVVVFAGKGDIPAANFRENIKAARKLGVPVLAYVSLLPDLYQGLDFVPANFPKGKTEKHVRMLSDNLHYASGLSEAIDGIVYDFSDFTMADNKTKQNDNWMAALAEHVTNQLFAFFKKPVYPLCDLGFKAEFTNAGGAISGLFNSSAWGSVSFNQTTNKVISQNGINIPADTEGPQPPFISRWDFWRYGSQSFSGLASAAVLMLFRDTAPVLYKELGYTGTPLPQPDPEDPPTDPQQPPVTGDLAALMTELLKIGADVKVIKAFIEDMRKL